MVRYKNLEGSGHDQLEAFSGKLEKPVRADSNTCEFWSGWPSSTSLAHYSYTNILGLTYLE
jgi:hypothetical protein